LIPPQIKTAQFGLFGGDSPAPYLAILPQPAHIADIWLKNLWEFAENRRKPLK